MTGRYTFHTGLQHSYLNNPEDIGLPLKFKTIGNHMKSAGYATHAVGKWHLFVAGAACATQTNKPPRICSLLVFLLSQMQRVCAPCLQGRLLLPALSHPLYPPLSLKLPVLGVHPH